MEGVVDRDAVFPPTRVEAVTAPEPRVDVALDALDDAELVRACVAGRIGAFDGLVLRHRRAVFQICYRFAGTQEEAADLAQDVFVRAYRAIGRFKGDSSFKTWLYRIAVNTCLSSVARKRPVTESLEDRATELAAPGTDAMTQLLADERAARVRAAIARLPAKQRATLLLRVYQELPHEEIAAVLGSSVGAVKANFFHALRNLRRLLGTEPL